MIAVADLDIYLFFASLRAASIAITADGLI